MAQLSDAILRNKMNRDKYDYQTAKKYNIKPDKTGHWQSRVPSGEDEGLILKLKGHPTLTKTFAGELKLGYSIFRNNNTGRLYSLKTDPGKQFSLVTSPKAIKS